MQKLLLKLFQFGIKFAPYSQGSKRGFWGGGFIPLFRAVFAPWNSQWGLLCTDMEDPIKLRLLWEVRVFTINFGRWLNTDENVFLLNRLCQSLILYLHILHRASKSSCDLSLKTCLDYNQTNRVHKVSILSIKCWHMTPTQVCGRSKAQTGKCRLQTRKFRLEKSVKTFISFELSYRYL